MSNQIDLLDTNWYEKPDDGFRTGSFVVVAGVARMYLDMVWVDMWEVDISEYSMCNQNPTITMGGQQFPKESISQIPRT